jgi:hypothetical protein
MMSQSEQATVVAVEQVQFREELGMVIRSGRVRVRVFIARRFNTTHTSSSI